MITVECYFNLGVLGQSVDGSCVGIVDRDEFGLRTRILKVVVHHPLLKDQNIAPYLSESETQFLERRLTNRFIAGESRGDLTPEDWNRLEGA